MAVLSELIRFDATERSASRVNKPEVSEALKDLAALLRLGKFKTQRWRDELPWDESYVKEAVAIERVLQPHRRAGLVGASAAAPAGLEEAGFIWRQILRGSDVQPFDPCADRGPCTKKDRYYVEHVTISVDHPDSILRATRSPVTPLANIRKLADAFCFVAMPLWALDPQIFTNEIRRSVDAFWDLEDLNLDVYALAPLSLYSLAGHVASEAGTEMYAPPPLQQVVVGLRMNVPMFRSMQIDVADLRKDMEQLRARVDKLEETTRSMQRQIASIQESLASVQNEVAAQRLEILNLSSLLSQAQAAPTYFGQDPLLFAVPRGTMLATANVQAILGPCWGADIDDAVVTAAGFRPNKALRAKYTKSLRWA